RFERHGQASGNRRRRSARPLQLILADVNVLIYAFRRDTPHHDICKPWLDAVIVGDSNFGISPLILSAVIRISTNPKIFNNPSPIEEALAFCNNLMGQPHSKIVQPTERHWQIFTRLCIDTETRGPRVTDAWFAALAIEHGCTWITYDRDYARF